MKKVAQAGNVVLDERNPYIRNTRDGTTIKLDANTGVFTLDMWGCLDMERTPYSAVDDSEWHKRHQ